MIQELTDLLDKNKRLTDRDKCLRDALEREATVSTCLPGGIALPHVRTDGVHELVAAIGIRREGYEFDTPDHSKTKIVVLSFCPKVQ